MKPDFYTKTILTVIAICLVLIVFKQYDFMPSAYASEGSRKVEGTTENDSPVQIMDVRIVDINTYKEMKVNVTKIDSRDNMPVNVKEIGGGWISHGGPLPVKVKN